MRKLSRKEAEEKMEAIFSALHYNLMDAMNAGGERTGEESYFHAEAWKVDQGRQKEDYRQTVMSLDSVGFKEYYKLVGQFATAYKIGCWKEYSECEPILIEELGEELGRREKTKEKLELINSFRLEELRSQTFSFDAKINALQDILDDFRVGNEKEEVINRLLASFSGKDSGAFIARLQSDRKLLNGLLGRVNYVDLWGLLASDEGRTVPNTWRDNKDGTYTALPGATLYELYGENWREESGYVGNPSNLQVGDTVGRQILSGNKSDIMIKNEEQVDKNLQYLSNENEKALIQIPITGLRGALGLGGGISLQAFYNPNDIWDSGLSLTTMAGIGIDIGIETPLSFISEKILNTVANNISTSSPTSSNDIVGIRTGASSGAFLGINYDIEEKNLSGDIGNIGGGVYITSTKVVTLKNVADYFREFVWWK